MAQDYIIANLDKFIVYSTREREKIILDVLFDTHYTEKIENFGERLAIAIGDKIFYDDLDEFEIEFSKLSCWSTDGRYKKAVLYVSKYRYIDTAFGKLNLLLVFTLLGYLCIYEVTSIISLYRNFDIPCGFLFNDETRLNTSLMNVVNRQLHFENASIKSYDSSY